MPINMRRVVTSPRLRNTLPLTIYRKPGHFEKGRWIEDDEIEITSIGIEAGVSEQEVDQIAEGDRVKGLKKFFTPIALQGAGTNRTPDRIESASGDLWQVKMVSNRAINGFYSAICVRIRGD